MKHMGSKKLGWLRLPAFLAIFAAATAIVMVLWNWLIPSIIGWSAIGFWQAAGLLLLSKLLFGGCGRGHGHFGGHNRKMHLNHEERAKMREDVKNMSPEERKEYIRGHMFGGYHLHQCRTERGHSAEDGKE